MTAKAISKDTSEASANDSSPRAVGISTVAEAELAADERQLRAVGAQALRRARPRVVRALRGAALGTIDERRPG